MTPNHQRVLGSRTAAAIASAIVTAVVLMGGIALANVPNGSVTSAKIRNGAVKSVDIRNGQVRSADIATGAVKQAEVAADAVGSSELKSVRVVSFATSVEAGTGGEVTATCQAGEEIVSWGYDWPNFNKAELTLTGANFNTVDNSVTVKGFNADTVARQLNARAHCIRK